jgi:TP901 family phage tail tape measure protein
MDFAEATDRMTAAIRGFKLEMEDAARVNDVFSAHAAKSATDTDELSIALTKTASIAANAGMELETTSAMLAQMIETTREAPENIGTAMKSIIARFQEMKKNPLKLNLEVEGEEINVNKVEEALKSAGVALRDEVTGQFRDLDDVFLELSGTWDTLSRNTQRYIATIAAGSRQQSRFLALMGDNERLTELIGIAQDSQNQSTIQFSKTIDSFQSKLNKLSTAWERLYTKFLNSEFFKGMIDGIREFVNQLARLSPETIVGLGIAFISLGKIILNNLKNNLGASSVAWQQLKSELSKGGTMPIRGDNTQAKAAVQEIITMAQGGATIPINAVGTPADLSGPVQTGTYNYSIKQGTNKKGQTYYYDTTTGRRVKDPYAGQQTPFTYQNTPNNQPLTGEYEIPKVLSKKEQFVAKLKDPNSLTHQVSNAVGIGMATGLAVGIATGDWKAGLQAGVTSALMIGLTAALPKLMANMGAVLAEGYAAGGLAGAFSAAIAPAGTVAGAALTTAAATAVTVASVLLIVAAVVGLGYLLWKLTDPLQVATKNLEKQTKLYDELSEKSEKLNAEYLSKKDDIKNLEKLKDTYVELTNQATLTADEEERLEDTISQIAELNPELIQGYDAQGNVILKQLATWESIVALQKESLELARQEAAKASLETGYAGIQKAKAQLEVDLIAQREDVERKIVQYKASIAGSRYSGGSRTRGMRTEYLSPQLIEQYETEIAELEKELVGINAALANHTSPAIDLMNLQYLNEIKKIAAYTSEDLSDRSGYNIGETLTGFIGNIVSTDIYGRIEEEFLTEDGETVDSEKLTTALTNELNTMLDLMNKEIQNNPNIKGNLEELSKNMSSMTAEEFGEALSNLGFSENVGPEVYNQITEQFLEINKARDKAAAKAARLLYVPSEELRAYKEAYDEAINTIVFNTNATNQAIAAEEGTGIAPSIISPEQISEQMFNAFISGERGFGDYIINAKIDPETANIIKQYFMQYFEELGNIDPTMFQKLGYNFTTWFTEGIENIDSEIVKASFAAKAQSLFDLANAQPNADEVFQAIQATDFGDMDSMEMLIQQMGKLGINTDDATDSVYGLAAAVDSIDFRNNILTEVEMMESFADSLDQVIDKYQMLNDALVEQQKNGKLSVKTILSLIKAGQWESLVFNKNAKTVSEAFKLKSNAAQSAAEGEINAIIVTMQAEMEKTKQAKQALVDQQALLIAKLKASTNNSTALIELEAMTTDTQLVLQKAQLTREAENEGQAVDVGKENYNADGRNYERYSNSVIEMAKAVAQAKVAALEGNSAWDFAAVMYKAATESGYKGFNFSSDLGDLDFSDHNRERVLAQQAKIQEAAQRAIDDLQLEIDALSTLLLDQQEAIAAMEALKDLLGQEWFDAISGADGSGGSAAEQAEAYKNALEKFYNILKQIEYWQNKIENLNTRRELLTDAGAIAANLIESEQAMRNLIATYEKAIPLYQAEVDGIKALAEGMYAGYLSFNGDILQINYDAISGLDEETQKAIEDIVEMYDQAIDKLNEYENAILEIQLAIKKLVREYRDHYVELEQKIVEILKRLDQEEIDNLKEKYDKMKEADDDYLESLQKNIDARRKARDRENTQQDLTELEKKLGLLRRDTSGVYALDILKLEQDIADKRRSIADTSTDDYLDNLKERYATEAELRDNEIEAMQEALDQKLEDMSEYWERVDEIMAGGYESILEFLMMYDEEFNQGSAAMRENWLEDWDLAINQALAYLDALANGFSDLAGQALEDIYRVGEALADLANAMANMPTSPGGGPGGGGDPTEDKQYSYKYYYFTIENGKGVIRHETRYAKTEEEAKRLEKESRKDAEEDLKNYNRTGDPSGVSPSSLSPPPGSKRQNTYGYDRGGLADYTGLAIVHGSKRKPEAFLDSEDTKNIAGLRDVLYLLIHQGGFSSDSTEEKNSSVHADINIYVQELNDSRDISEITQQVREEILKASRYRNNVEVTIQR